MADLRAGPEAASIASNAAATSGSVGRLCRPGACPARVRTSATARPRSEWRSYAAPSAERSTPATSRDGRPRSRPSRGPRRAGPPRGTAGRSGRRPRSAARRASGPEVVGEQGGLLGGPGRGRDALRELAPAAHGGDGIPCRGDGRSDVVPRVDHRPTGRPAPARAREPGRVPALVRGPRDRPARALPGNADAARGDRAVLHRAGRRDGGARDGRPRPRHGPADRHVRVQPARRRERLGAVPHHDRRVGRLGARATAPRRPS